MDITAKLHISFKKESHVIEISLSDTLLSLKERISELVSIPSQNLKLMYKKTSATRDDDDSSLWDVGIRDGLKILVIGSTSEQIEQIKSIKNEGTFERQRSKYAAKPSSVSRPKKQYFGRIQAKIGYPKQEKAQELLERIANDNGIQAIMENHNWKVGLLREMTIEEAPDKLGHNVNKGLEIALRLRFEDGFRSYQSIKGKYNVMIHELTHMQISPHDNSFYALYRNLHKEAAENDWTLQKGNSLGGSEVNPNSSEPEYEDVMSITAKSSGQRLGGSQSSGVPMRDVILQATLRRVTQEEVAISEGCGTVKKEEVKKEENTKKEEVKKEEVKSREEQVETKKHKLEESEESMEVSCPICNCNFPKEANRELNRHIDQHLNS